MDRHTAGLVLPKSSSQQTFSMQHIITSLLCIVSNKFGWKIAKVTWDYEHIGRVVVVRIAVEAAHMETVVVGPTGSAVGMAAGRTVAVHTAEVVDSIDFVVLGLDRETSVTAGRLETAVVQAAVEEAYYIQPALGGMVMRVRHMGQE